MHVGAVHFRHMDTYLLWLLRITSVVLAQRMSVLWVRYSGDLTPVIISLLFRLQGS
jgi:hypothetical protein